MSASPSKEKNKRQHPSPSSEKKNFMQNVASKVFEFIPSLSKIFGKKPNVSVPNHEETDLEEGPPPKRMRLSSPMQDCNNDENFTSSNPFGSLLHTPPGSTMRHDLNFPSSSNNVHEINNDIVVEKDRSVEISVIKELPKSMIAAETVTSTKKYHYEIHPITKLTVKDSAIAKTSTRKQEIYFHRRLLTVPFYAEHVNRAEKPECTIIQPFKEIKAYRGPEKGVNSREICVSARRVLDLLDDCVSTLPKAKKVPQYVKSSKRDKYASKINRFAIASTKSHKYRELQVPSNAEFLTLKTKCRLPQIMASQSSKGFVPYPCIMRAKSDKLTTKITQTRRGDGIDMNETVTPVVLPSATLEINEQELPIILLGKTPLTITPSKSSKYILSSGDDHNLISPIQTLTIEGSASQPVEAKMFTFSQPAYLSSQETEGNLIPPTGTSVSSEGHDSKKDSNSEQEEMKSSMKVEKGSNLSIKNNFISKDETENTAGPQNKTYEALANNIKYGVCRKCNDNIIDNDPGAEKYISPGTSKTNNSTMIIESPPANSGTTSSFKNIAESQKNNKWECSVCLVSNANDSTKCVCCCAERKSNTSSKDVPNFGGNNNNYKNKIESPPANSGTSCFFKDIVESQKSNKWECSVCLVSNTNDSTKCACCCAERKPNTSSKDMPNFGVNSNNSSNKIESPPVNSGISSFFNDFVESQKSDKWECSVCLVSNTNDSTKCACCCAERKSNTSSKDMPNFGGNSNNSSNKIESPPVNSGISSFFKDFVESQKSDKWECSFCLVSNTNDSTKCACCCAERKSNTSSKDVPNFGGNNNNSNNKIESPPANTGSSNFKDIAESQKSNKWECSICLVLNTIDSTKCACCCAERKSNTSSKDMSNFGGNNKNSSYKIESPPANSVTSSSFKDIIERQKSYKWKCSVCLVTNTTDVNKCACCSTLRKSNTSSKDMFNFNNASAANPGTSSSFRDIYESQKCDSWACSDCFASNPNDSVKCVCCYAIRKSNTSSKDIIKFVTNNNNSSEKIEPPPAIPGTSSSFKDIAESQKCDSWACSVCFVLNPLDSIKCACCYTPRKSNVSSKDMSDFGTNHNNLSTIMESPPANPGISSSFKDIVENQKCNSWACPVCFVLNSNDLNKCACCYAPRKANTSSKDNDDRQMVDYGMNNNNSSPKIGSSLVTPGTSSSLKHISERLTNNKWTCPICLVSNLNDLTMCACCCAARKSDTNSKDTFNFGINTRNNFFDTDLKAKEAVAGKNPEPVTFKFGICQDKSALNEGGSTTNSTEQNKMVEYNDQVQEVPSVNLNQENTKAPLAGNVSSALPSPDCQKIVISGARIRSTSNSVSFQHAPVSLNAASTSISTTTSIVLPSSQSDSAKTLSVKAPTLIAPVATSSLITPAAGTVGTNQTQISTNVTGNKSGPGLPTPVGEGFASGIFGTNSFGSNTASGESHSNTIFSFGGTHPNMGTSVPTTGLSVNNVTVGDTPNSGNGTSSNSGLTVGSGPLDGNRLSVDNSNLFGNISVTPLHTLSDGSGSSMFGQIQKENIWTPSNNVTTPKKPTFVFGATSFNANPSPAFSNVQSTPSVFGMDPNQSAQISNQGTVFPVPLQNPLGSNIFITPSAPNQAPEVNIFSAPAASAAPFGNPPAQPAAFNFGATANPVVFGFGQQQPQQSLQQQPPPPQQPGVYNFSAGGGTAATAPQMQFRMGSAPTTAGRRMRKAVRRTTPR